jgi:hypothetical protein
MTSGNGVVVCASAFSSSRMMVGGCFALAEQTIFLKFIEDL